MIQGFSPPMRRLIRRRLSKALGTQAQLVSLQADQISGQAQGYCTAQGRLSRFRFSAGGRLLLLKPLLNLFRWDRSAA
mgnify:FL=1|jgi:hypothetical protein